MLFLQSWEVLLTMCLHKTVITVYITSLFNKLHCKSIHVNMVILQVPRPISCIMRRFQLGGFSMIPDCLSELYEHPIGMTVGQLKNILNNIN